MAAILLFFTWFALLSELHVCNYHMTAISDYDAANFVHPPFYIPFKVRFVPTSLYCAHECKVWTTVEITVATL